MEPKVKARISGNRLQFVVWFTGEDGKEHLKYEVLELSGAIDVTEIEKVIAMMRDPLYHKPYNYEANNDSINKDTTHMGSTGTVGNSGDTASAWSRNETSEI